MGADLADLRGAPRRRVLYVLHPVRPSAEEIREFVRRFPLEESSAESNLVTENVRSAERWLQALQRLLPEVAFVAPWVVDVLTQRDDESRLQDAAEAAARCDGIVLIGPRASEGTRRVVSRAATSPAGALRIPVYDLTGSRRNALEGSPVLREIRGPAGTQESIPAGSRRTQKKSFAPGEIVIVRRDASSAAWEPATYRSAVTGTRGWHRVELHGEPRVLDAVTCSDTRIDNPRAYSTKFVHVPSRRLQRRP